MEIIKFEGMNCVFAEGQPTYRPLPAYRNRDGVVISCWQLSPEELAEVARTGRLWVSVLTFNRPLQPMRLDTDRPAIIDEEREEKRDLANASMGAEPGKE